MSRIHVKPRTRRFGPFWFERYPDRVRFGFGTYERLRITDLRKSPWSPLFSVRNGLSKDLIVMAGPWLLRVRGER